MRIEIPELAVVALVGASGSGKSTFAKQYFKETEILSSDFFRGMISDDENNQKVSSAAFDSLYYIANKRLDLGLLTVIDATNVQKDARAQVVRLAKAQNCQPIAIVLDIPEKVCIERNQMRMDRKINDRVIKRQSDEARRSIRHLGKEGFRAVYVLKEDDLEHLEIIRQPLWVNKKEESGPFDLIGDIHGCFDELVALLEKMGYFVDLSSYQASHPEGRKAIFLGDLCDRGPQNYNVLRLVMNMVDQGKALCVCGNHDAKLLRKLNGANSQLSHGLDRTMEELVDLSEGELSEIKKFLDSLISHYVLDQGKLVVAHAGLKEKYQGRASGRVREFCLYGETTGETDEYGLPVRLPWAEEYRGESLVVFGHTPCKKVQEVNRTICIDTGCVFGNKLTSYRYPENEYVQVDAKEMYYESITPLGGAEEEFDDVLNIKDVLERRFLSTKLKGPIKIPKENATGAFEIMSRFGVDPHWLIYLPPTMSPCETSSQPDYLEYPAEAFQYYKDRGVTQVICEEKHMGSRAVIVVCKDLETAKERFSSSDNRLGVIYTRTGRTFFNDEKVEKEILDRLLKILGQSNFWEDHKTNWVCLDVEIMPWSAKALSLIEEQYASVGRAGREGLKNSVFALEKALQNQKEKISENPGQSSKEANLEEILKNYQDREKCLSQYVEAYRPYCWNVESIEDYRVAPFHILATEGKVWTKENHSVHMETIKKYITGKDEIFMATSYFVVDLNHEESLEAGIMWWKELTAKGGEGMVVKSLDFITFQGKEPLQPAVKCRGKEYLRIIYGPEYTRTEHLSRLKKRGLGKKRNLALNEFALGIEALERFVEHEPLYRVHECVFGVLALDAEPVDPKL